MSVHKIGLTCSRLILAIGLVIGCDPAPDAGNSAPAASSVDSAAMVSAPEPASRVGTPAPDSGVGRRAADSGAASAAEASWGHAVLRSEQSGMPVILKAVRVARNAGFERIVFEFGGGGVPGYRVSYIDDPVRECGSGRVVALPGEAWLEVKLSPAQAHDDAGRVTVAERTLRPALANMKELTRTCDFEADVTWVAGLSSPNDYRVMTLRNPTRLVVDVRDR